MADELALSNDIKGALDKWIDEGAKGDLNDYLDVHGIVHPHLIPVPPNSGGDGPPICPNGQVAKSSYVHVGNKAVTVWSCG